MKRITSKKWIIFVIVGAICICAVLTAVGVTIEKNHVRRRLETELETLGDKVAGYETTRRFQALNTLATSEMITSLIALPDPVETTDLLTYLNGYKHSLEANIIYLMNHSGDVIACTPYDNGKTLTGKNYRIRPYFQKALAGDPYLYGALGLTTGQRGFYFSTPVTNEMGDVLFVLVAKFSLSNMDKLLKDTPHPSVLLSPSGIIFSSSTPDYLFRPAFHLSKNTRKGIKKSKQFPNQDLRPLPFVLDGDSFLIHGQDQMVMRRELNARGWQLVSWAPYSFPLGWVVGYSLFFLLGHFGLCYFLYFYLKKKEIQTALQLTQRDYQAIFNASADAIFVHDLETGHILDVNEPMCAMYRCKKDDVLGNCIEILSSGEPPYSTHEAGECVRKAAAGEEQLFEWHARKMDGELFWVEVHLKRTQLEGVPRLIAVVRDISERMEVTTRLRKLSKAIEASPASVMISDRHGIIEYVNAAFSELTGYPASEVVGQSTRVLKSGIHAESYYKDLWETIVNGNVWSGEMCNLTKDNRMFWELARIAPIFDNKGDITHFVAVKGDITELKMAEKMLRASKQEAEQAAKAKSTFLANMSHEIRTPLNAVLGFIDLTNRNETLPSKVRSNLKMAQSSAQDLLQLINDILDTSKLDSGKMLLENICFDLYEVLDEVSTIFDIKAKEKGLVFKQERVPELARLHIGDPGKVKQVLYNVVGNAVKFTEEGSVQLTVHPGAGQNEIVFEVRDTGIGIPLDMQDKIFAPFIQADGSTTRRFGGSGLGTTISRQLVELMGGRIWLQSNSNQGSTFFFVIPLPDTDDQAVDDTVSVAPVNSDTPDTASDSLNILMAEDVEVNARLTKMWFEGTEHRITVACDGAEALTLYKENPFDLILMDVHMPKMDGLEATRAIRHLEEESGEHIPIFALTASVMTDECEQYLAAGMDDVVGKPIDFDKLFSKIDAVSNGEYTSGPLPEPAQVMPVNLGNLLNEFDGYIDFTDASTRWGDQDFFLKALVDFIDDYSPMMEAINDNLAKGQLERAAEHCHKLKGISGNLSFSKVFPLVAELESILMSKERLRATAKAKELTDAFDKTHALLIKLKETVKSP